MDDSKKEKVNEVLMRCSDAKVLDLVKHTNIVRVFLANDWDLVQKRNMQLCFLCFPPSWFLYYNKDHISNLLHLTKFKSTQILCSVQQWPVAINLYLSPGMYALVAVTLPDLNFKTKHDISQVQMYLILLAVISTPSLPHLCNFLLSTSSVPGKSWECWGSFKSAKGNCSDSKSVSVCVCV